MGKKSQTFETTKLKKKNWKKFPGLSHWAAAMGISWHVHANVFRDMVVVVGQTWSLLLALPCKAGILCWELL